MDKLAILAPVLGVAALLFAAFLSRKVSRQDAGTDRMKEIASYIHEGAQAFLMAEYKILVVFVAVLFVGIGLGVVSAIDGFYKSLKALENLTKEKKKDKPPISFSEHD